MRGNRLSEVEICRKLGFNHSTGCDEESHPAFLAPNVFCQP